ncbi:shikimate 5-dehydrogenase [Streptococcus suis]|nr:shikimate 5-dehydrogenase [Streptococcus suis]
MNIDGYTRLAAVVAKPIKHSISPFILIIWLLRKQV